MALWQPPAFGYDYQKLTPALQSSIGRSLPWAGARLINAFAEQSEGDKQEVFAVMAIPGATVFATPAAQPVRGLHRMGSMLYAIVGTTLYSVASDGSATALGTVLGTNPTRMADNGTQLAIHDGSTTGYVLSGGVLSNPLNLPAVSDVAFIDGYFVWPLANSDQFMISAIGDGTSYDPLDIATVEGSPDQITGVISDHRELEFFGGGTSSTPSTEIWFDSGNADFPIERQGNAFIERGCIDKDSLAKLDNTTYFVGDDRVVYAMQGYTPVRVSTHAVERTLAQATWFRAFSYTQEGHVFYVLNTDAGTWVYDASNPAWHERISSGFDYYRMGCSADAYGTTFIGDNQGGNIYQFSLDSYTENGAAIPITIQLPPVGDGVTRRTLYSLEVFMETGVGDLATTDPQIILTYSKDGGRNWSNEMWRSMGAQGEYATRAVWRVNVQFRQLQLKLQLPDKVRRCVIGYFADVR